MIKTNSKIGNSCGLIFDSALLQLARLKEDDPVNVEGHAGGTITIVPFERDEMGFATRSIWMSINGNRSPSTWPGDGSTATATATATTTRLRELVETA